MGLLSSILGQFVGNKGDRDLKELNPIVDKVAAW